MADTCSAACLSRVDLPTAGSPPTRTTLPGTTPPPSTRLSSPQARERRGAVSDSISLSGTGRLRVGAWAAAACLRPGPDLRTWNSWSVFHAWQCGHWPAQRRLSPPHSEHMNVTVDLGISATLHD